ncbi:MAG: hypothetical protein RR333_08075, partial [Bacteroidales bacterium]
EPDARTMQNRRKNSERAARRAGCKNDAKLAKSDEKSMQNWRKNSEEPQGEPDARTMQNRRKKLSNTNRLFLIL